MKRIILTIPIHDPLCKTQNPNPRWAVFPVSEAFAPLTTQLVLTAGIFFRVLPPDTNSTFALEKFNPKDKKTEAYQD